MDVYGIKTCDTCRKARRWLDEAGIAYRWHDLREAPPDAATLDRWIDRLTAERLINRRSTTWRGLDDDQRAAADSAEGARELLSEHPTLIKRPVIEAGKVMMVGFTNDTQRTLLELP